MNTLLEKEFTNIIGIDEHTALILNGEDNSFEVEGIGNVTVINHKEEEKFAKDKAYNLDELKKINANIKGDTWNLEIEKKFPF